MPLTVPVHKQLFQAARRNYEEVSKRYEHSREVSAIFLGLSGVVFAAIVSFVAVPFASVENLWPLLVEGLAIVLLSVSFSVLSLFLTVTASPDFTILWRDPRLAKRVIGLPAFWKLGRGIYVFASKVNLRLISRVSYYFELSMVTLLIGLLPVLIAVPLTLDPPLWLVIVVVVTVLHRLSLNSTTQP
jgi:hypothetical protein